MDILIAHILRTLVVAFTIIVAFAETAKAGFVNGSDSHQQQPNQKDTIRFPLQDRYGDPYSNPNRNTFDLRDTAFIKRNVEYDPLTGQYYIIEKIGNKYYRTPASFTMNEFLKIQAQKDERAYFRQRADLLSHLNRRNFKPKFGFSKEWVNRITGNGKVEIKPTGYVDLSAGYQGQNIKNPTLPERARKMGNFDFNQNAQLQVDATIGDKIRLPINYIPSPTSILKIHSSWIIPVRMMRS